MDKLLHIAILFLFCLNAYPQFPPPAGQEGTTAIHKDSSVFITWSTNAVVVRGYSDISVPDSGFVTFGEDQNATGYSDNIIVSLGDGGYATLTFDIPLANGPGPDFAVFENAFLDDFLELAFVEVSSDGINFFRFDAVSLTQTDTQVETFGYLDATQIHNLAGKYRVEYGMPFDLEELNNIPDLNINSITHVKIIDVIGCIQDEYATYDSQGNKINDPWPTPFPSGGFDLDAVGVIHNTSNANIDDLLISKLLVYPNPVSEYLFISFPVKLKLNSIELFDLLGKPMDIDLPDTSFDKYQPLKINISSLPAGMYMIMMNFDNFSLTGKIFKK
jgi:hypothetical protein